MQTEFKSIFLDTLLDTLLNKNLQLFNKKLHF